MSKILWSGVKLTEKSQKDLNYALRKFLWPILQIGWVQQNSPPAGVTPTLLPDHMTMAPHAMPEKWREHLGQKVLLEAKQFGICPYAAAVAVETDLPSFNQTKHVTVAVSPYGKPFHSNEIKVWYDLDDWIELHGIVIEEGA